MFTTHTHLTVLSLVTWDGGLHRRPSLLTVLSLETWDSGLHRRTSYLSVKCSEARWNPRNCIGSGGEQTQCLPGHRSLRCIAVVGQYHHRRLHGVLDVQETQVLDVLATGVLDVQAAPSTVQQLLFIKKCCSVCISLFSNKIYLFSITIVILNRKTLKSICKC